MLDGIGMGMGNIQEISYSCEVWKICVGIEAVLVDSYLLQSRSIGYRWCIGGVGNIDRITWETRWYVR